MTTKISMWMSSQICLLMLCGAFVALPAAVAEEETQEAVQEAVQETRPETRPAVSQDTASEATTTAKPVPQEAPPARSGLLPVPFPDLGGLEPAVAVQLADAQDSLVSLISLEQEPETQNESATQLSNAYGTMGQLYHAYGLLAPAEACYRNAVQLSPAAFRWSYLLAKLLQHQGQLEQAIAQYERTRELAPDSMAALVNLGEAYLEANQAEKAQVVFSRAVELDGQSAAAHAGLGQTAFVTEQYADAVQHFETALQLVPAANRLHYPLAMAYRQLKNEEQAKTHLEQHGTVGVKVADPFMAEIESLVQGARLQLVRGKLAFQAQRYREAAVAFNAAIQADPTSAAAWVNLGTVLVQMDRVGPAMTHFREALRLQPDNLTAHYNLGALLLSSGNAAEAVTHLRTTVIDVPTDQQAHRQLGAALRQLGRGEEALVHYAMASTLNPNDEVSLRWSAELLSRQGRFQAARTRLEDAYRRFPARGRTAHALARLLATSPAPEVRDGARALAIAEQIYQAKKIPQHAETIALALAELGRCEEASTWQRELVEIAEKEGDAVLTRRLRTALTGYEKGSPCRPPVLTATVAAAPAQAVAVEMAPPPHSAPVVSAAPAPPAPPAPPAVP